MQIECMNAIIGAINLMFSRTPDHGQCDATAVYDLDEAAAERVLLTLFGRWHLYGLGLQGTECQVNVLQIERTRLEIMGSALIALG